ncbi:MAG: hypothetical protein CMK09_12510 [Ponticaulis sp.]|nr:hypothetical protein [Ponticaulis sp.]|tara:strand:- start:19325 stop:19642 length:318 start_codon:yes stop_codon:yes gene_type:complete
MTFDQIIELASAGDGTDGWGAPVNTWTVTDTFRARVITETGEEFVNGGLSDTMRKRIAVETYYRTDIKSSDRLIWQGETYEITSLVTRPRRNRLHIQAVFTEGVG